MWVRVRERERLGVVHVKFTAIWYTYALRKSSMERRKSPRKLNPFVRFRLMWFMLCCGVFLVWVDGYVCMCMCVCLLQQMLTDILCSGVRWIAFVCPCPSFKQWIILFGQFGAVKVIFAGKSEWTVDAHSMHQHTSTSTNISVPVTITQWHIYKNEKNRFLVALR